VNIKRETNKPTIKFVVNDATDYNEKFNKMGKINVPGMVTELTQYSPRNDLIIAEVLELLTQDRKILILSERRNHCNELMKILLSNSVTAGVYLGGMGTSSRDSSVLKQVIIGTYQASGEGFDVPDLDTLILATPKSDVEQAVGRILRQKNKNEPLVVDFVDSFSIFRAQYYKRKKFYKLKTYLII
jgi:superfamily II DNA or RNA helicase